MIIKSKPRRSRSFGQLLNYLEHNKGRGLGEMPMIITQNIRGATAEDWTNELEANEPERIRKNATRVLHEIISFHVRDKERIDNTKLGSIAREYIMRRSRIGKFVAIAHTDDEHVHLHICGSPWDMKGKSLRLSRVEFKKLKTEFQDHQREKFPELAHSVVDHRKEYRSIGAIPEV